MPRTDILSVETKAEAASWLARLHADDRSEEDERAFQAWLRTKPENARAFEAVTALWDLADGLRAESSSRVRSRFAIRRRTVLASLGSLAAAGAGLAVWQEAYAGVYETEVGEQKHVRLSDGTEVLLDTDTRIRERFGTSLRKVRLDRGQANFRVKPEMERMFAVEAGRMRVLADRTAFDIRRDDDRDSVVLLEGHATVLAETGAANRRLVLVRGQRAVVASDVVRVDRPDLAPLVAWQTGQAMFESETLRLAAAEMNRYSSVRLETNDPTVAKLRLSGVYRVGDNEAFARAVSQLLPVLVEHYPDHLELVRDESRWSSG